MQGSPIELLVIDDCPEDREEIRALLLESSDDRYRIREAATAAEGFRALREQRPECILLDYRLPDQDGLLLLRKLRVSQGAPVCPVILMTGSLDRKLSASGLNSGAQDFISKDEMTPELLGRTIQHAIMRHRLTLDREAAMQALSNRESLLRTGQQAGGIGTFDWNLITGECSFGGEYFRLYGRAQDHEPVSFEQWLEFIHPEDRAWVKTQTEEAISEGTPVSYKFRAIWPDKSVHWILGRATVVFDGTRLPLRLTGVNIDITELKRAEQALVDANQELQQFAYAAGHDLQAPLRSVSVFTELLEQKLGDNADEDTRQALTQIREGTRRMHTLVSDLLLYAQAGSLARPQRRRISLRQALELALENLDSDLRESGAKLSYDELPNDPSYGEELVQVFQNLVGNAIQYSGPGTAPCIRITATMRAPNWVLAVQDQGEGFDMANASLIFQAFKRLDSRKSGTGLGLAICKRIVERSGGYIWAEAEPGAGATFFFTLPVATKEASTEDTGRWNSVVA